MHAKTGSVNANEIAHFARDSKAWWDESGPFRPLHRLNPARIGYIRDRICAHFEKDARKPRSLKSLEILDIGCGGGLVCEPLARLGADVTGIDADVQAIEVARKHAAQSGLSVKYLNSAAEDLPHTAKFDVVLALEIIEHVADPASFVASCAKLCKPGGLVIFSTLNRTKRSFALGIVAAEYILGWVRRGTHDWRKFIKPSELSRFTREAGLETADITGLILNPLKHKFETSKTDIAVNYFLTAEKKP